MRRVSPTAPIGAGALLTTSFPQVSTTFFCVVIAMSWTLVTNLEEWEDGGPEEAVVVVVVVGIYCNPPIKSQVG